MTEYLKHLYSKRVYEVKTDHGPDHPYLSHFPYVRYVHKSTVEKFFTPCSGPIQDSHITVLQEIDWEKRQLRKEEPIVVKAPAPTEGKLRRKERPETQRREKNSSTDYTLVDLCGEIGMDPAKARKLLRAKGKKPPEGTWRWPKREAAKSIRRFLKKS